MGKYCKNCGNEMKNGARFCGKCGAPVVSAPVPPKQADPSVVQSGTTPSPRPAPVLPSRHTPSPVYTAPVAANRPRPVKAAKKRKGTNALCIVLAILLVAQIAAVALYGWPGFAVGGGIGKSNTFTLQEGQTSVETDSGVMVDFGPYNAMDGEKVSIKEMSADTLSVEGGVRTAYDITAGERSEFDGLITITLPYDESETDAVNEAGSVFAEYFNEQSGEWELAVFDVNAQDNTVTITTDHLSRYCTVTVQDVGAPYALLSKFSGRTMDDETALAILQEFEQLSQPGEVGNTLLLSIYSQLLPDDLIGNEEAELLNDVLNWLADAGDVAARNLLKADLGLHMVDHVSQLPGKGGGYLKTINLASKLELLTLGLSTVSLAGAIYDAKNGDESAETVAAQAYKLAYNAAMAVEGAATGAMKLSMLGVIAIDYSLNKFMAAADQTYKDALFKVVIAYNEDVHPRTDAEWYAMILKLYQNHSDNPDRFKQGLDGIMRNFSARYFSDNPEEQQVATNAAGLHAYTTGILPETETAKEYCIDQYQARLGERLQPVMEDVFKKIQFDARKEFTATRNQLRQALNTPLTFEVLEEIPDGEKSQYAGAIVVLSRPGGKINDGWTTVLNAEGCATIDATILGYMQAGVPTQLRLWLKGDDHYEDDPVLTQKFTVTERVTTIVLNDAGIDAKWFEGSWRYLDSDVVIRLEIIDGTNCSYTTKIEGEDITTYTTYVFDKETNSLKMAYSTNNNTGGRISMSESVYSSYQENGTDYIVSNTSGNRYQRVK